MNNQEAFNIMYRHAQTMPAPAIEGNRCSYRTSDGNRCLVGAIIPDELYVPEMDYRGGAPIGGVCKTYPAVREYLEGVDMNLLAQIQMSHDDVAEQLYLDEGWRELLLKELRMIANFFELEVPNEAI